MRTATDEPQTALAAMLCRLGYWRRGDLDSFHALMRPAPPYSPNKRQVMYIAYDQAMDAAIEAQQLRFSSASSWRRALSAGRVAARRQRSGPFPCLAHGRAPLRGGRYGPGVGSAGSAPDAARKSCTVECAVRAYPLLGRISALRGEAQFAAVLLSEGETLGERRGWRRLTAACLYERFELFMAESRWEEAQSAVDRLARLAGERADRTDVNWPVNRFADLALARLGLRRDPLARRRGDDPAAAPRGHRATGPTFGPASWRSCSSMV